MAAVPEEGNVNVDAGTGDRSGPRVRAIAKQKTEMLHRFHRQNAALRRELT